MKILLFSHSQDIDGAGCAILSKVAFNKCEIIPTKTFEINDNVSKFINDKSIFNFDKIFVTDLCIKEPLLSYINENSELKNKVVILDHHKTEMEEGNNKYSFVNIVLDKDGVKQSGTSLFYNYLIEKDLIKQTNFLDEFVENTRQYDIWEWESNNNYEAKKLHILFESLGFDKYIEIILNKINDNSLTFSSNENNIIYQYEDNFKKAIEEILNSMKVIDLLIIGKTFKVGFVRCSYKYRNDINKFIKTNNKHNIDVVGMIILDMDTVSYRQVKDCDVSVIAKYFGGKGHREAASNLQSNSLFVKIINDKLI